MHSGGAMDVVKRAGGEGGDGPKGQRAVLGLGELG